MAALLQHLRHPHLLLQLLLHSQQSPHHWILVQQ
jgi:hypothetical protein